MKKIRENSIGPNFCKCFVKEMSQMRRAREFPKSNKTEEYVNQVMLHVLLFVSITSLNT